MFVASVTYVTIVTIVTTIVTAVTSFTFVIHVTSVTFVTLEIQLAGFAYPNLTLYARSLMLWYRRLRLTKMIKIVIGYDLLSTVGGYELMSTAVLGF